MKKIVFSVALLCFITMSTRVIGQDEKEKEKELKEKEILNKFKEKKQSQEIIIRKSGDKDAKITVEINGDKVTINGKPLSDFKDDNITINKRKITVFDRNGAKAFDFDFTPKAFAEGFGGANGWTVDGNGKPYAFLGVTTDEAEGGAKISQLTKESAAEKAGLKEGDIITKINDKNVDGPNKLSDVVRSFKPKEEVTIYYKRDGRENSAKTVLGERKEPGMMSYSFSGPDGMSRSFTMPKVPMPKIKTIPRLWDGEGDGGNYNFNFNDGELFPRHQKLGLKIQDTEDGSGVKVLDVDKDSPAEKAGLKKDDVVTEVGGKKVNNTDEAREQLSENQEKPAYTIKAKRNGSEMNFDIKIPKKLKTANL